MSSRKETGKHYSVIGESYFNMLQVEILGLSSRIDKYENQVNLRLGNIENVVSQIQEKLGPQRKLSAFSFQVDEVDTDGASNSSSRRSSGSYSSPNFLILYGLDVKRSESQIQIEKKVNVFLREILGLSWEQIKGMSLQECLFLEEDAEKKSQTENCVMLRLQKESDVELMMSRSAVAELQGFAMTSSSQGLNPSFKQKNKKLKKSKTGYILQLM